MIRLLVLLFQEWETVKSDDFICHPSSSNLIAYSLGHQYRDLSSALAMSMDEELTMTGSR